MFSLQIVGWARALHSSWLGCGGGPVSGVVEYERRKTIVFSRKGRCFVSILSGETSVRGIERIGPTEAGKLLTLNPRRLFSKTA